MRFPAAFTLHRSPSASVRVEPPDRVIVEGPAIGLLSFRRAQIRWSGAMLVRVYRERHDISFAAANDDDILIRFQLEGEEPQMIGPFARAEGAAIAEALELAQRDLLLATPAISVSFSSDGSSLVIATHGAHGHLTTPVPTSRLEDLVVRGAAQDGARHWIPTGLATAASWIELVFLRERPWSLGPLSGEDANALSQAFRAWRAEHPIDARPTVVDEHDLAADPSAWHLRRIDVTAEWQYGLERSRFVGAWLDVPEHAAATDGIYRARVVGTWIYPSANQEHGYGHMGCWPGEMRAETIEILEVRWRPKVSPCGLTGLPKRDALGDLFQREAALAFDHRRALSIALLDIDRFKMVNDTYGYTFGDAVIRDFASHVVGALRPGDVVTRWGGDKLALLLPDATLDVARELLERVVTSVRARVISAGEHRVAITVSAGVIEVMRGETLAAAVVRADQALYQAKRAGRDRVVTGPRLD